MAVFTKKFNSSGCPLVASQKVVGALIDVAGATEFNVKVPVPFKGYLAAVQTVVVAAMNGSAACEVDIELSAAGGTEIYSLQIAQADKGTVGTLDTGTKDSTNGTAQNLTIDNDYLNVEVVGGTSATAGQFMIYFVFEVGTPDVI